MRRINWDGMSIDELWTLQKKIAETLAERIADKRRILEERLRKLPEPLGGQRSARPYPKVLPKYRNPDRPSETWSGRGKQPRWLTAQLRSGKRIDDFLIAHKQRDPPDR